MTGFQPGRGTASTNVNALPGLNIRPDVGTPQRVPGNPEARNYLELKPNTPSGQRAAARAVRQYKGLTGRNVRAVFYDPADYLDYPWPD